MSVSLELITNQSEPVSTIKRVNVQLLLNDTRTSAATVLPPLGNATASDFIAGIRPCLIPVN